MQPDDLLSTLAKLGRTYFEVVTSVRPFSASMECARQRMHTKEAIRTNLLENSILLGLQLPVI